MTRPSDDFMCLIPDYLQAGPRHLPELSRRFEPRPGARPVGLLSALWRLRQEGSIRWDQAEQVFTLTRATAQEVDHDEKG